MTIEQIKAGAKVIYEIDRMETLAESAEKDDSVCVPLYDMMPAAVQRWRDLNANFFREEAKRLKKELEAL